MLLRALIFLALVSPVLAAADADRQAAYERLRQDALVTKLLDQAAVDIKSRHYEAALKKADAAAALHPDDPIVLNTRGAALAELKRFPEADKVLAAAVAADPKAFAPQFNQGELLSLQKKYSDAAVQFALLQSRFGPIPILKYKVYLSNALAGQKSQAAEALRTLRYPEDGPAWYFAYAVDRLLANQRREADRLIAAATAIHKDEVSTYVDTLHETGLLR